MPGNATFYPGKLQKPVTTNLTESGHAILHDITTRWGRSRSDVFEHLLRMHGKDLQFGEAPPRVDPATKAQKGKRAR